MNVAFIAMIFIALGHAVLDWRTGVKMTCAVFNHVKCLGEIQSPSVLAFSLYTCIFNLFGTMAERTICTPKRTASVRALTAFVDM